jgi:hypothetical protein
MIFARHMAKALTSKCGVSPHGVIYKSASDLPLRRLSWRILAPSELFWHIFLALPADVAQAIEIPYFGGLHTSLMTKDHAAQNQGGAWQIHQLGKFISVA